MGIESPSELSLARGAEPYFEVMQKMTLAGNTEGDSSCDVRFMDSLNYLTNYLTN